RGAAGPVPAQAVGTAAEPGRGARGTARPPRRVRSARPGRGRGTAGGRRGRPGRRSGRGTAGEGGRRGTRVHRRPVPGHPYVALARTGRLAARRHRVDGDREGVGLAARPGLRDPGRREGAGPADAAAPGTAAAGGPARRRHRRRRTRLGARDGTDPTMITWRPAVALAAGAVVVPLLPAPGL